MVLVMMMAGLSGCIGGDESEETLRIAFSVKDGSRLWSTQCKEGYNAPVDVLVADGRARTRGIVPKM